MKKDSVSKICCTCWVFVNFVCRMQGRSVKKLPILLVNRKGETIQIFIFQLRKTRQCYFTLVCQSLYSGKVGINRTLQGENG